MRQTIDTVLYVTCVPKIFDDWRVNHKCGVATTCLVATCSLRVRGERHCLQSCSGGSTWKKMQWSGYVTLRYVTLRCVTLITSNERFLRKMDVMYG